MTITTPADRAVFDIADGPATVHVQVSTQNWPLRLIDTGEACDPGKRYPTGDDGGPPPRVCRPNCAWSFCGDGIVDPAEECDNGSGNNDHQPNACRKTCRRARCGDGVLDNGEECDDGEATGDPGRSLCLNNCREAELEVWPPEGEVTLAFEDLPIGGGNDYDYNDWVSTITIRGLYGPRGMLWGLNFHNVPMARGAGYSHDQHIEIPGSMLQKSGRIVIRRYSPDGALVEESATLPFAAGDTIDVLSIENTRSVLPPNQRVAPKWPQRSEVPPGGRRGAGARNEHQL